VWRICSQQRLWSLHAKKRGLTRKAGPPVHDDLVLRRFTADRVNQLWLTDITEHRTDAGKIYLCAIKDMYSRRIVGYSISDRMTSALAVRAVRNAIRLRGPVDTILHSDRGSIPFQSLRPNVEAQRLDRIDGRVGACGDNAAMESFFSVNAD
jgi:putative transposase